MSETVSLGPLWDARYRVVRTLGAGGMGRVLLVEDELQGGRVVALKRLDPESVELVPAFLREFRIHRQLAHPNIPRVYELGFGDDHGSLCPYFTMEVAPGVPLLELLARYEGGLPLRAVMQIATGLLRALDHLHRLGWVHGDLKPGNLLVSERASGLHVHLIDFGVALPIDRPVGDDLTITPEYAAPELLRGGPVDARADLYAVGLLLYEMLEHRRPWPASDLEALHQARIGEPIPALTATSCPPVLAAIVQRLLAPARDERFASAAELLFELGRATAWEAEIEPPEAFLQHLLTVHLPWRAELESLALRVTNAPLPPGEPWAIVIDVPMGFFARRLLGPVLDEAAARRARIIPIRFDDETGEALPHVDAVEHAAREPERLVVFVIENLDVATPPAFAPLAAMIGALRPNVRVVGTRRDPERGLPELLQGPGVLVTPLSSWSDEDVRRWLGRALGEVGAPWEDATAPLALPKTPASLVEALVALHRQGNLVRRGPGYLFRELTMLPARGAALDPGRRPESLDALLACVKSPIPEAALPTYLASFCDDIPDLVQRGLILLWGDGTLAIADEPRRATLYGRLAPARRHALHRRLAQALEEVAAPPHRIADEWLDSDAPLLAVPHLLAAAEARPGRSWLSRATALIERARALLVDAAGHPGVAALELWRYEALILRTRARVLLACGRLDDIGPHLTRLVELGIEVGHRYTIHSALEIRLAMDLRLKDWDGLVRDAAAIVSLEGPAVSGVYVRPGRVVDAGRVDAMTRAAERTAPAAHARLHWARALRFRAEGLPAAALAELETGLSALGDAAAPAGADAIEVRSLLYETRADLCLDVQWRELAEDATRDLVALARRAGRPETRARARILEVMRLRMEGRFDRALASAIDNAECLPRERTPTLDALVELELGWSRFELGDLDNALDHARCADTLAQDEGSSGLMARAAVLEATAAWYLGWPALAWKRAQEAVRAGGSEADSVAVNARLLVLELALAMRGHAAAEAIGREAAEAGWRAHRRMERAREARAFRLAAEAAIVRRDPVLALQHAERGLHAVRVGGVNPHLPRHLVTLGRARLLAGAREAADATFAEARAELMSLAERFEDSELRERWLAHPDQRGVLGKRPMHSLA